MIFLRFDEAPILSSNMCIIYEDEAPTLISVIGREREREREIYIYIYTIYIYIQLMRHLHWTPKL